MMQLLVIRHAIAVDRDEFAGTGEPDDLRPLTARGMRRMRRIARGLISQVPSVDHLATSPFKRAAQTAEIVGEEYKLGAEPAACLVPDARPEDFERWAASHSGGQVVAIVGHEPHLSTLVTWLLGAGSGSRVEMKKGGVCLLEFDTAPARGKGTLLWLLTPGQLRSLG